MPHIAQGHERHYGHWVGDNQHCVSLVRECSGLPHTSRWRRGKPVRGSDCAPGTVIATFDADGRYGNHTDGRSHAAIYLEEAEDGIWVADQWLNKPSSERLIQSRKGIGKACDDADRYHVIELQDDGS